MAAAAAEGQKHLEVVTDVGYAKGIVEKVASSRRILGPDGKVKVVRFSANKDPKVRAYPEGNIDPYVRMVSFWHASAATRFAPLPSRAAGFPPNTAKGRQECCN